MKKQFVTCLVEFGEDGTKIPKLIIFDDVKYDVDKLIEVKNCASFKAGGFGERYTVKIKNKTTYLFFEEGKWFVEAKC